MSLRSTTLPYRSKLSILLALLLAGVGVCLCALLLGGSGFVAYRFVWVLAFGAIAFGNFRFLTLQDKREQRCFGWLGFLFVTAQALGYRLELSQSIGGFGWLLCLGIGLCAAPAAGYLFALGSRTLDRQTPHDNSATPRKTFWISFVVIVACWLPVFLAYYPGLFSYDVGTQIDEIVTGQLTNRNPLLHTLFLGGFYLLGGALGSYTLGVAMSVVVQLLTMAAIFAYLLRYLRVLNASKLLRWSALLFFALVPIHSMLAISCTKDTLFCGFILLFAMCLHQLSRDPKLLGNRRWFVLTLLLIVLIGLLRNNAFFGLAMCVPLGFLIVPKERRVRLTLLILGALLVTFASSSALKSVFSADGISPTELVSVPAQQMSRVYALHHDQLPASVEIEYYLPTVRDYIPYTADPVKSVAVVNHPYRMWGFIKLWGKIGLQYPSEYIDAFLLTNRGYWWLDDTTHAQIYGQGLAGRQGYLLSDTKKGAGVTHTSLIPPLETLYEQLFSANDYQKIPVLSVLFAPSLYIWFTLFLLCRGIFRCIRSLVFSRVFCYATCFRYGLARVC